MASKTLRLDKILSHMNIASRSDIKKMARQGCIQVNGETIIDTSRHFDPETAVILVNQQPVRYQQYWYWMMNKPQNVVSATYDGRDRTVLDLMSREEVLFEPFPVGRLDKDTEGLLLLTNDGELAHFLLSPRFHVPKTYFLTVQGVLKAEDIEACHEGLILEDGAKTLPSVLNILSTNISENQSSAEITIHEGKYHQVKRMMEVLNCEVTYLKRIRFGPLTLDENIQLGDYRLLTEAELELLRKAVQK